MSDRLPMMHSCAYRPYVRWSGTFPFRFKPQGVAKAGVVLYAMHLVWSGAMRFEWSDGETITCSDGQAVFIPPVVSYATQPLAHGRIYSVHFSVDQNPAFAELGARPWFGTPKPGNDRLQQPHPESVWGVQLPRQLPDEVHRLIARELPDVVRDWTSVQVSRHPAAHHRLAGLLLGMVDVLAKGEDGDEVLSPEYRITLAEMAARDGLRDGFSTSDMAQAAGYARCHFSTVYQRLRDETPGRFLERLRLSAAQRLLRKTSLLVVDVAGEVGYPNQASFTRFFKTTTGMTPSQWRQKHAK